HRGFLDGDFVMMLYAWSPNWRLNTVGHDRYELYIRRSFDGAGSWTTLPASFTASDGVSYTGDGTVSCETYRTTEQQQQGDSAEPRACYGYAAGANEQARNVTQHQSMRITTLDPRYAKTPASIDVDDPYGSGYALTDEDVRDPSRYFIVFETGDNTTTADGEPEPLDLFYSRAVNFGDDYQVWAEEADLSVCYPSDPHGDDVPATLVGSGFCNEFDQLEQGKPGLEASEASLAANPGGEFMYAAWAQALIDDSKVKDKDKKDKSVLVESDAMARRVWWIDDYIPTNAWDFGQGPNGGQ
ncbi:choice-of-anchor O protein, partial [Ilumatobacter sp.]|uniref:choice-of-anchor O protein n=1 Tax=Ilumatobacter sp. TaxID=1967498 RepID=UPI003AF56CBD